jgi:hypothetical protein
MKRAKGELGKKDDLWADLVKERDAYTCQWPTCGIMYPPGHRQGLHAHHIFRRTRMPTRHMLENGVALCFGHHMIAHADQLEFADMMRDRLGAEEYEELGRLSRKTTKEVQHEGLES